MYQHTHFSCTHGQKLFPTLITTVHIAKIIWHSYTKQIKQWGTAVHKTIFFNRNSVTFRNLINASICAQICQDSSLWLKDTIWTIKGQEEEFIIFEKVRKGNFFFFIPSHIRAETTEHSCVPRVFRKSAFQTITYKSPGDKLSLERSPACRNFTAEKTRRWGICHRQHTSSNLCECSVLPTGVSEQTLLNAVITALIVLHCSTNLCGG